MNTNLFPSQSRDGQLEAIAIASAKNTTGKVMVVCSSTGDNYDKLTRQIGYDRGGQIRLFTTPALALAACVAGRGDVVVVDQSYTTAFTAAEVLAAETKGVAVVNTDGGLVHRAAAALPQTAEEAIFTVTGKVKLISIIGEVTTEIENQANNTKLVADPTVGSNVDLCAVLDIDSDTVGTVYTITGTVGDALADNANGVLNTQAAPLIVPAGAIDLNCAASNTGEIKWSVRYEPITPGARIIAA
jgi:hypothetical protein